jgi:hypothetical protein
MMMSDNDSCIKQRLVAVPLVSVLFHLILINSASERIANVSVALNIISFACIKY